MYCDDGRVASLLLALHKLKPGVRDRKVAELLGLVVWAQIESAACSSKNRVM